MPSKLSFRSSLVLVIFHSILLSKGYEFLDDVMKKNSNEPFVLKP
jgi:hypothetical protein